MRGASVRFRLTAWYAVILAATFAIVGAGVWLTMRESIHDTVDKDLRARLEAMRQYLEEQARDPEGGPLAQELAEQVGLTAAGSRIRLATPDGRWIYRTADAGNWPPRLGKTGIRTVFAGRKPYRVVTAPVAAGTVEIAVPIGDFYEMLEDFTWTALLASPVLLLLASAGGYWMSRRALAPVDHITRMAAEIGARNLSRRLPLRGSGDELDRLSATLNGMFSRLQDAFERITRFTADASHELRTPVAVIRTTAELARGRPRTAEEYERVLDRILSESERTSRLIEDLLLLARADAGADEMACEPVDLAEAVRDACEEVKPLAGTRRLEFHDEAAGCTVQGDGRALRRLFLILLDNAIKYTPADGGVLVIAIAEGPHATVEVRDTGIGIAAEDLPHIFERFYRASKDRSRETGGAGLGLAIAQWIAARHGGAIEAESAPGRGSTFRARLPRVSPLLQNRTE